MSEFERQFSDINDGFNELIHNLNDLSIEKRLEKKVYSDDGKYLGITVKDLMPEPHSTLSLNGCLKSFEDKVIINSASLKKLAEMKPEVFQGVVAQLINIKIGLTETPTGINFLVSQEPLFESYEDRMLRTSMEALNNTRKMNGVSPDSEIYDENNNKTNIKIGDVPANLREKLNQMKLLFVSNYGNVVLKVSEIKALATEKPEIYGEIINTLRAEGIDVTIFEVEKLSNLSNNYPDYRQKEDTGYLKVTNINPSPAYKAPIMPSDVHNVRINESAVKKIPKGKVSLMKWVRERLTTIGLAVAIVTLVSAVGVSLTHAIDVGADAVANDQTTISDSEKDDYSDKINMLLETEEGQLLVSTFLHEVSTNYADSVRKFEENYAYGAEAYKRDCGIDVFEQKMIKLNIYEDQIEASNRGDIKNAGVEDLKTLKSNRESLLSDLVEIAEKNDDKFGEGDYAIFATATVIDGKVYYQMDLSKLEDGVLPEGSKIVDNRLYAPDLGYAIEETTGAPKF